MLEEAGSLASLVKRVRQEVMGKMLPVSEDKLGSLSQQPYPADGSFISCT